MLIRQATTTKNVSWVARYSTALSALNQTLSQIESVIPFFGFDSSTHNHSVKGDQGLPCPLLGQENCFTLSCHVQAYFFSPSLLPH